MDQLFAVDSADAVATNDDWYTPRWMFDAAGIVFDLDVAAPVDPDMRTCPAKAYLTVVEDGLAADWYGTIWMNPPFSRPARWIDKFATCVAGLALVPALPRARWLGTLMRSADAMTLLDAQFGRPDGSRGHLRWPMILVARGEECVSGLIRVAAADRYVAGAYHVRPA